MAGINHYFGYPDNTENPYANVLDQHVNSWSIPEFKNARITEAWGDILLNPLAFKTNGVDEPTFAKMRDNGAGSIGIWMLSFPTNKTTSTFFSVQVPHNYKEESTIYPHFHFGVPVAGPGTNIHFQLEWIWDSVNIGCSPTSTVSDLVTPTPTEFIHTIASFTPWSGVGKKISSIISGRVSRVKDAQDTYPNAVTLLSVDWHYQIDSFGSLEPTVKGY